jgi:hypothetical protein
VAEREEMRIDWSIVKKKTLWNYEELTEKIIRNFSYRFIQECYNHNMKQARVYASSLLGFDPKRSKYINEVNDIFTKLESPGIADYEELVHQVESREKCQDFVKKTKLPFEQLILTLNHIFRWVLPHTIYLKELIDEENETQRKCVDELMKHNIRFNLDILEQGRTREGRHKISEQTGVPKAFLLELVNRADMSRLPYSNRKTVKHLSAAGYDTLRKLAETAPEKMMSDMKRYFDGLGVKVAGFIDLKGIAQWARTIPRIVENA